MRIRITRLPQDVGRFQRDDIDLSRYIVGEVYDVGSTIGTYLIVMGFADPEMRLLDSPDRDDSPPTLAPDVIAHHTTVLLVDDILDQLDMYEMALEGRYRVLRASRGREAFDLAVREQPDIIVLDVVLPDVNGVMLCQWLKASSPTASIPVMLLTAHGSALIEEHGLESGAAVVLEKPCPADKLIAAIERVLVQHSPSRI
jgi:CheY-like chemotaxis protein